MKTCRNLLLATFVVLSCLFAFQPAGAVAASALTSAEQKCDDIGPLPDRLAAPGFGVGNPNAAVKSALMAAPACVQADDQDTTSVASNSLECNSIGPLMAGQGTSGFLASTAAPACMVSPSLLQPVNGPDARLCEGTDNTMPPVQPCWSPD
jgi:hypothetical protein